MKRFLSSKPLLWGVLLVVALIAVNGSCSQQDDELTRAADLIRQHAAKQNPAFRHGRIRFSGILDDSGSDGVCACIQVCDANGGNCTSCSCSPSGCGKCS